MGEKTLCLEFTVNHTEKNPILEKTIIFLMIMIVNYQDAQKLVKLIYMGLVGVIQTDLKNALALVILLP